MNLIFLLLISSYFVAGQDEECSKATDCKTCMEKMSTCGWCSVENYEDRNAGRGYRCASPKTLKDRGCPTASIDFMRSKVNTKTYLRTKRALDDNEIQLKPLSQSASIRPGMPLEILVSYKAIGNYPVDLYYLTDLSYSMKDDLKTVSDMTKKISEELGSLTKRLRMGFGGFVDKPVFPFVNPNLDALRNPCINLGVGVNEKCDPPFLYKHVLSLTSNFTEFQERTRQTTPSGNLDSPEGGLDALLQVAHCNKYIDWNLNARKIVLFTSDGGFHTAGDGRLAGLIKPPPRQCQLNYQADRFNSSLSYLGWHNSIETDYPSVGEVASVLTEKGINVIFATNEENKLLYDRLAEFLPNAAVGVIEGSSDNIVELLKDNYKKILSKVALTPKFDDNLLDIKVMTKCQGESEFKEKSLCSENPTDGQIEYRITVNTKKCFDGETSVVLQIGGLKDNATLLIKSACECAKCAKLVPENNSAKCNGKGQFECGACTCEPGYAGDFCECSTTNQQNDVDIKKSCTKPGDLETCSGRGRCKCGTCHCSLSRYTGTHCECDKLGCKRAIDDNLVCGGPARGDCLCNGTCKCKEGYRGERCDCLVSNKNCQNPTNSSAPLCSGRGQCDCGYCFCESGYAGDQCQNLKSDGDLRCSQDKDKGLTNCMLCLYDSLIKNNKPVIAPIGTYVPTLNQSHTCQESCNTSNVDMARIRLVKQYNTEDGSEICVIYNKKNCRIYVTYKSSEEIYKVRKLLMSFQITSECPASAGMILIIVGVIVSIVIVGIVLLLIWKLVVTIDDRREIAIYQEQLKNAKWETEQNPIFRPPITTVKNPLYAGGDD